MAIIPKLEQEDEQKEMELLSPQSTSGAMVDPTLSTGISGGMVDNTGVQSTVGNEADQPNRRGSGLFQDVKKYVKANQGAGQRIAGAIGQDLSSRTKGINQAIQSRKTQETQRIQDAKTGLGNFRTQALNQIAQADSGVMPEDVSQFRNIASGKVGEQFGNSLNLAREKNRFKALESMAGDTRTEQGRFRLLGETFGDKGDYTRGESGLDQLLLQRSQPAIKQLQKTTDRELGSVSDAISGARTQYLQNLSNYRKAKTTLGKNVTDALTGPQGAITTLKGDITSRADAYKKALEALSNQSRLETGISGGQTGFVPFDTQALETLGIKAPKLYGQAQLFGVDPTQFLSGSPSSLATQEELARAQALAKLAGREQDIIADPGLVGQSRLGELNQKLINAQRDYERKRQEAQTGYQPLVEKAKLNKIFQAQGGRQEYTPEEWIRDIGNIRRGQRGGALSNTVLDWAPKNSFWRGYRDTLLNQLSQAGKTLSGITKLDRDFGIRGESLTPIERAIRDALK